MGNLFIIISTNTDNNWITSKGIDPSDTYETYVIMATLNKKIASIYWAVITMTTIGYGDIVPTNSNERIFVTLCTLFSSGVFAYVIN
jgi:hypothetical protein